MLWEIKNKPVRRVVGMMSGTSVDGIDAALVEISGSEDEPKVSLVAFENLPFPEKVREKIFELFTPEKATVDKLGYMNFLLGEIYANSALSVIKKAGLRAEDVDLISSHGQTIWHEPVGEEKIEGMNVPYTVQIGEGSVIAAKTGIVTVSDFRVADMAYGGQGAPLVPFSEYMLYRRKNETILLQNIGGIGNMTVLPAGCGGDEIFAFDTGPGNMIIDAVIKAVTKGQKVFDEGGAMAAAGKVNEGLLKELQQAEYYTRPLPKTTGRELFGEQYTAGILAWQNRHGISDEDLVATVTELTAWSIADAYGRYVLPKHSASTLIVGGGGSYNAALMAAISRRFASYGIKVCTQEDIGLNSDAKEAVAFALLGDRCIGEKPNVLTTVTGAKTAAIMGKISLPGGK